MIKEILLLGSPQLYEASRPVSREELAAMKELRGDLHDTMMEFRRVHRCGRAIAAPQIGVMKRVLYMNVDKPMLFINPRLEFPDGEQMEVLDDCMSFPGLLVRVDRYRRCRIIYKDLDWKDCVLELEGDLSELLQHEYDHLDGILATMRAKDNRSFILKAHAEREKHIRHRGTARLETDRLVLPVVGLNRVQASHDTENPGSGRVMEKCGLKKEGVLRQSAKNCRGIYDSCIHGMLASDYFAQKNGGA